MIKDPTMGKHSHNNRESKTGLAMRFIREGKKLSLKEVATKLQLKVADVDHLENGRKFFTDEEVSNFLVCYNFSQENFKALMELKVLNKLLVNHFLLKL